MSLFKFEQDIYCARLIGFSSLFVRFRFHRSCTRAALGREVLVATAQLYQRCIDDDCSSRLVGHIISTTLGQFASFKTNQSIPQQQQQFARVLN